MAQQSSATARLVASEASRLLNDQPGLAKQLALTAYRLDHGSGEGPLLAALAAPGVFDARDSVLDLAATRDGRTLLMATGSAIQAWSTEGHVPGRITGLVPGPLAVTPDGRFVYASNRGHDSVAVFAVEEASGRLSPVEHTPCGAWPRNLCLTPSGRYLFSANQHGDLIAIFARDEHTGRLTDTGRSIRTGTPMCVKMTA